MSRTWTILLLCFVGAQATNFTISVVKKAMGAAVSGFERNNVAVTALTVNQSNWINFQVANGVSVALVTNATCCPSTTVNQTCVQSSCTTCTANINVHGAPAVEWDYQANSAGTYLFAQYNAVNNVGCSMFNLTVLPTGPAPTLAPPTAAPVTSSPPTHVPTATPSQSPVTPAPSAPSSNPPAPSFPPSPAPTVTPTHTPTSSPTPYPTSPPSSVSPTATPSTGPTSIIHTSTPAPSNTPSKGPTTRAPSRHPTFRFPTAFPSTPAPMPPPPAVSTSPVKSRNAAIAGGVVGGFFFLLLVLCLIWVLCVGRRHKKPNETELPPVVDSGAPGAAAPAGQAAAV